MGTIDLTKNKATTNPKIEDTKKKKSVIRHFIIIYGLRLPIS